MPIHFVTSKIRQQWDMVDSQPRHAIWNYGGKKC